jgi:hypothetical protein
MKIKHLIIILLAIGLPYMAQAQKPVDSTLFLAKSRLFISPIFSVSNRQAENVNQVVRQIQNQSKLDWDVRINTGYFVNDNFSVGAQLGYGRLQEDISYTNSDSQDITEKTAGYAVNFSPNIRNYFGPGKLKVFNQTNVIFSVSNQLTRKYYADDQDKIRTETVNFGIGLQPGLAFFATRMISVEVSINLLGWNTEISETVTNDVEKSRLVTSDVSFSINILTVNLGIGIYLNELIK